ncbi:MAG: hypothetical protein MUF81_08205 [Verrucomicrobia bacterium]|jgi:hypothetical protein|nr:hypothetical protein [Verrucomicrobiota bacterium]
MSNREFVLKAVRRMSANASFQKILRELDEVLLVESVKRALANSERGARGVPAGEVRKRIKKWIRDAKPKSRSR